MLIIIIQIKKVILKIGSNIDINTLSSGRKILYVSELIDNEFVKAIGSYNIFITKINSDQHTYYEFDKYNNETGRIVKIIDGKYYIGQNYSFKITFIYTIKIAYNGLYLIFPSKEAALKYYKECKKK